MSERPPLPTALKTVAALFMLGGLVFALQVAILLQAKRPLDLNVVGLLGLIVGPGLLLRSRFMRLAAVLLTWVPLILMPVFAVLLLMPDALLDRLPVLPLIEGLSRPIVLVFYLAVFLVALWQFRVLVRPDVRSAFGLAARKAPDVSREA